MPLPRILLLLLGAVLTACATREPPPTAGRDWSGAIADRERWNGVVSVYRCGVDTVVTRLGFGELLLWSAETLEPTVLTQTRTASGARFDSGEVMLWMKGDGALHARGGGETVECTLDGRESLRIEGVMDGAALLALGSSPEWSLLIFDDGTAVRGRVSVPRSAVDAELAGPAPERGNIGRRLVYEVADGEHTARIDLESVVCVDPVAGERFPFAATLVLDGATLAGCGQRIAP
ncbi:MAG: hypothetical protein AAGE01_08045 [Pseudomonadota bacterium]